MFFGRCLLTLDDMNSTGTPMSRVPWSPNLTQVHDHTKGFLGVQPRGGFTR